MSENQVLLINSECGNSPGDYNHFLQGILHGYYFPCRNSVLSRFQGYNIKRTENIVAAHTTISI